MNAHIVAKFDGELEELLVHTLSMGQLVRAQLALAGAALQAFDDGRAEEVVRKDSEVNGWEVRIDREIESIFARRQPAAGDLRLMLGVSRVSVDLERMGDEARNIARTIGYFDPADPTRKTMAAALAPAFSTADLMIREALRSLKDRDAVAARQVIGLDRGIDDVFHALIAGLIETHGVKREALHSEIIAAWIAKSIERVGDHVKNIAETVIYICEGADIHHEFYTEPGPGSVRPDSVKG